MVGTVSTHSFTLMPTPFSIRIKPNPLPYFFGMPITLTIGKENSSKVWNSTFSPRRTQSNAHPHGLCQHATLDHRYFMYRTSTQLTSRGKYHEVREQKHV